MLVPVVHIVYHFDIFHHEHNKLDHRLCFADNTLPVGKSTQLDNTLLDHVLYYYSNFAHLDNNEHLSDRTCVVGDTEPELEVESEEPELEAASVEALVEPELEAASVEALVEPELEAASVEPELEEVSELEAASVEPELEAASELEEVSEVSEVVVAHTHPCLERTPLPWYSSPVSQVDIVPPGTSRCRCKSLRPGIQFHPLAPQPHTSPSDK